MANEVDYSPRKYTGNGSTTEFSFNWKIFTGSDITVRLEKISTGVQTTLTYGTDYGVTFGEVAGYITLTTAPTSEYYVIISRNVSDYQSKKYSTSTGFQGSEIENSFDKVSCNLQELDYTLQRSIKVAVGSSNLDMTLPAPSAGKTLKWNEEETGLINSTIDVDELESIATRLHASIDNIDTVAEDITNVNTVASAVDDVIVVSGSVSNVNTVGTDIENVNAVAGDLTNIDTVKADLTNIDTVAGISNDVTTVAGISGDVTAVKNIASNVTTVAGSVSNVNAVGADISNVNAVAGDLTNIDAVKTNATNINAVAGDLTNINAVANDLTNIDSASGNATLAKQYAVGLPSEPTEGSAKYWAGQAAAGQIQADWSQTDNTKKDFIKNKPTKLSDFTDDTSTNPVDFAEDLTDLTVNVTDLNKIESYSARDFDYLQPDFIKADKGFITIKSGTTIKLKSGEYFHTNMDLTFAIGDVLDTGSVAGGKDYYFYMNNDEELVVSLSDTAPTGYTADDVVLIGGAHTLCVSVTSSNAPSLPSDSFWSTHPAIGYDAGHFIPNSSWTPAFKSGAKTGNKGQVLIDHYGIEKFWVDIYLQSGTGSATASSYSGTITNSRQPIQHQFDMNLVGKKLPTDQQFTIFAEGSNQCTNIAGGAIPTARLTGGYTDTAGKRMISGFFVECCCGYLWQWGDEIAPVGGSGWNEYAVTNRGSSYGMPYVLKFGGVYADSSHCGSWARSCSTTRTRVDTNGGARGVSLHIEIPHK